MMGESAGGITETGAGGEYMDLLQTLDRKDILEILSEGFCQHCEAHLQSRILNLINRKASGKSPVIHNTEPSDEFGSIDASRSSSLGNISESSTATSHRQESPSWSSTQTPVRSANRKGYAGNSSPASANSKQWSEILLNDGLSRVSHVSGDGISDEQKEHIRCLQVGRKKDFVYIERISGKQVNVLQGLELHTQVFNAEEQEKIVECVYNLQRMGQRRQLRARTYTEPRKWMRGKGRVTIQFGCCYNYAVDKNGNPPGIIRDEEVDPLPPLFNKMIKRMIRWSILPPTCVPNSCIVNIYDEGDCIPPHIDHHDFLRPFCTVSFLTECNILFGSNLKILDAGEFSGPVTIPLPVGSVLILNGNGADIAKHCVPGVRGKRISITFRKMDDKKMPYKFVSDPELMGVKPLEQHQQKQHQNEERKGEESRNVWKSKSSSSFSVEEDDFPPLGSLHSVSRHRTNKSGSKQ